MDDDREARELVEVANRGKKYPGGRADRDQKAIPGRLEDGQQGVGIVSYGQELYDM